MKMAYGYNKIQTTMRVYIYICRFMSQFAGILCLVCTGHLHLVDVIKVLGCLCVSFRLKLILHNAVACYWINTYIWALRKHWNEKGNCYMLEKDCDDSIFIRLGKLVCKIWQKCFSTEYWMIWEKKYKRYFIYMNSMKIFRVHKKNQTVNDFKAAYTAWMSWIYIKIWKVFIIICCSTCGVYKAGVSLQQKLKPCYICVKTARKKRMNKSCRF